jgi:GH25 family lysozyme M1 (1,4-beta-N-acetylmuramidase)
VGLRSLIGEIGAKYDRRLPMSSEAQMLLRQARVEFEQWIPAGYRVEGGRGRAAATPSIAVYTAAETSRSGLYVAYLFAADMSTVTLSLNQGINEIADHVGRASARRTLTWEAADIRASLRSRDIADLDMVFDLHSSTPLAIDYQRANVVSRTYQLDALPSERTMVADLRRFIRLYALALGTRGRGGQPDGRAKETTVQSPADTKSAGKPKTNAAAQKNAGPKPRGDEPERTAAKPKTNAAGPKSDEPRQRPAHWARHVMTRRRVLAGLLVLPAALVAPAALVRRVSAAEDEPKPPAPAPAPQFTIDVSQHDWDPVGGNLDWDAVRQAGIVGMCARATYGDPSGFTYPSYHFGDFVRAAKHAGFPLRGGYHNLVRGDQASINRQVDWLRQELDAHDANWAMLDIERYTEMVPAVAWPLWDDVQRFDDRWAAVDERVLVGYLPSWNWSKYLGQPDLRAFRGPLIASNYPVHEADHYQHLYERSGGDKGPGWASYGNRTSEGWQFSSTAIVPGAASACDINAWRMSSGQLYATLTGAPHGAAPAP